ncbi:hypothetical protein HZC27_02655 [Candidatus Roizmanbacteria bacterium]|nr:hypothetical protein [Candidatus Roizmanbacteria bacterium]
MTLISNQKSGDDSTNLQAGGDIVINSNKVALYSIEEVARQLMGSVFGELPDETKKQIEANQKSYFQALSENLGRIIKQNEELKKVIDSPDFQYISKTASISASRSSSAELHKNLSSLITQRINNDDEDLKRIVYDEAIATIGKLTTDQLKIITLCYLLRYTSYDGITSWDTFKNYLNTHIKPFIGFKNTNAEFQHIEYAGCGSIGIGSWNLVNIYRQQYSFLFFNLIEKDKVDNLSLPNKNEIVVLDSKEDKYFFKFKNKIEFENHLKKNKTEDEIVKKLISLYESNIKSDSGVKKKIFDETDIGKDLLDLLEKSNLNHLTLTSVGIAIGASYFEQITGEKIDISIWIN